MDTELQLFSNLQVYLSNKGFLIPAYNSNIEKIRFIFMF